ncbi:hypothetical protein Poli38472_010566 [Pythium oligandrum]|uniref:phosphoglycerate kinase n=1 Tax=Pythium oligandrum TaxID=41045 RepID=A0A8K1C3D6_PYTOL|nr:hypothetical protein Poli38472_010566 [Pythium oligandrum]|eukprot:TMW55684.1 hypothetical protein Poli38472_010566 [Pythium oligandrum]
MSVQACGSKPSSASSASGKKTRTILVARNLSDAEANKAIANAALTQSARFAVTAAKLPRDEKTGKLSSYAALGGEADIERYERFLSDKKLRSSRTGSTLSADGSRSGSQAFQNPKASFRRRPTDNLLSNNGSTSPTNATGGAIVPSLSRDQLIKASPFLQSKDQDAKSRREAIVRHRKWLKSLPIHERLSYERQQNVLKKWKQINDDWEKFKSRTSKRLGKSEKELVMSRASEYREQIEMYDALQRAMPLSEKVGPDIWLVTLRNDGTRYVPVGNIFSGLYCPIRLSSKIQPRVRRPLDYLRANEEDEEKPLTTLDQRSRDALMKKKRRLKKQLQVLFPHEVESSKGGHLKVETMDLFEWAAGGAEYDDDDATHSFIDPHASAGSLALPLVEDQAENDANGINSQRSNRSRQTALAVNVKPGPHLRLIASIEDAQIDQEEHTEDENTMPIVPLSFYTDVAVLQQQSVSLVNCGTTALQFQWTRIPFEHDEISCCLTACEQNSLEDPDRDTWTSISVLQGFVLPGETQTFEFSFQSKCPGVWLEKWVFDVDPPTNPHTSAGEVHLECTAVDNFEPHKQRVRQADGISTHATSFMVEQVVRTEIINRLDPQQPVVFPELSEIESRAFYDAHRGGEFDSIHFSPTLVRKCQELYVTALEVVQPAPSESAAAEPVDPVEEAVETQESPSEENAEAAATFLTATTDGFNREWDLKLASLKTMVLDADAKRLEAYKEFKQQLLAQAEQDVDEEEDENSLDVLTGERVRRKAEQEDALEALVPHFHDDFQALCLSFHISPYEYGSLETDLGARLADMCGETPVVHEIAQMLSASGTEAADMAQNQLGPLIVRALDESIAADQAREKGFEAARRAYHNVDLRTKPSFTTLLHRLDSTNAVTLLQIDLDVANWYTLVALTPTEGASTPSLAWNLSEKLLKHETCVPAKVISAIESIQRVLETVSSMEQRPTLVLLTELSTPPMTKAMRKLETATAKAIAVATTGSSSPSLAEIEAARQKMAHEQLDHLSLKGLEQVLSRGLPDINVEFVAALEELETMLETEKPKGGAEEEASHGSPRVILMEHMSVLARQATRKRKVTQRVEEPSPTAAPANDKARAAANKKASVTAVPPPKAGAKDPPPVVEAPVEEEKIEIPPGSSLEMVEMQALGRRLAGVSNALVVDAFPLSWWESTFVFFATAETASSTVESVTLPAHKHILVGPSLDKTMNTWANVFQAPQMASPPIIKAVVGGRNLNRKLRLIDGLLERCDTIYFVGEVAMAIYRVLHTKKLTKALRRARKRALHHPWQPLIPAVERIQSKAYRKNVTLLLPFDMIIGEQSLESLETPLDTKIEDDEDDEDEANEDEEAEEEEEEDEDDDPRAKKHNQQKKAKAKPIAKPLPEPLEIDMWSRRLNFDGERARVELQTREERRWVTFAEVTERLLTQFAVVDGNRSLLEPTGAGDAEPDEGDVTASLLPTPTQAPELDWTFRVFDVGPHSMRVLVDELSRHLVDRGCLVVNGTPGVVELVEFDAGTRELHTLLKETETSEGLHVVGQSTTSWLQRLDAESKSPSSVVTTTHRKNAFVLRHVLETKPHAKLTSFG